MTSRPNGQPSIADRLLRPGGTKRRTSDDLPPFLGNYIPVLSSTAYQDHISGVKRSRSSDWQQLGGQLRQWGINSVNKVVSWRPRDILGIPLILVILWAIALWWGEEAVFRNTVDGCTWNRWENWVYHTCLVELKASVTLNPR